MESIILAIAKMEGVTDVRAIVRKTGFKKEDVIRALYMLALRGKIDFALDSKVPPSSCSKCPLNKFCNVRRDKKWN